MNFGLGMNDQMNESMILCQSPIKQTKGIEKPSKRLSVCPSVHPFIQPSYRLYVSEFLRVPPFNDSH